MTDIFTPKKRSWIMSRIRSHHTGIDIQMREILKEINCGFKMYPRMHGHPDFVIYEGKIVIFCDGDFWHGYRYHEKKKPAKKFWRDKINRNMKRDKCVSRKLRRDGLSVLRFWEHDIERKQEKCRRKILRKIMDLNGNRM